MRLRASSGMARFACVDDDNAKLEVLKILMDHYYPGENKYFNPAAIPRTAVYCLEVEHMTGKRKVLK